MKEPSKSTLLRIATLMVMLIITLVVLSVLVTVALAEEPAKAAPPTVEQQLATAQGKIAHLEAQLAELRLIFQYELQVCSLPDLMRAKLNTLATKEKAEKHPEKPPEKPHE